MNAEEITQLAQTLEQLDEIKQQRLLKATKLTEVQRKVANAVKANRHLDDVLEQLQKDEADLAKERRKAEREIERYEYQTRQLPVCDHLISMLKVLFERLIKQHHLDIDIDDKQMPELARHLEKSLRIEFQSDAIVIHQAPTITMRTK